MSANTWVVEETKREYTGKITDCQFGYDERFGPNLVCLMDVDTDAGYPRNEILTCGPGWATTDNGKTATHPTRGGFSDQSNMGRLVKAVITIPGAVEALNERGAPTEAGTWVGLNFYWEEEKYTVNDRNTGLPKEKTRMLPTRIIDGGTTVSVGAVGATASVSPVEGLSDDDNAVLLAIAKRAIDHDDFVDQAYKAVEGIAGFHAVEAYVLDGANWGF